MAATASPPITLKWSCTSAFSRKASIPVIDQKRCATGMVLSVKTASAPAPSQAQRLQAMMASEPSNCTAMVSTANNAAGLRAKCSISLRADWKSSFQFAHAYANGEGMKHYVNMVQEPEFAARDKGYTFVSHQQEVGAGYFDDVTTVIQGGSSSVKALTGSTEEEQFH